MNKREEISFVPSEGSSVDVAKKCVKTGRIVNTTRVRARAINERTPLCANFM